MSRATRYCRCGAALAHDHPDALCAACQSQLRRHAAPTVPPEFWAARGMSHAVAGGELGPILRAYRHHPHHGETLSQQLVAGWLHISQSSLSRLESGARRPTVDDWEQCTRLLGVPVSLPWARTEPGTRSDDVEPIDRRSLLSTATTGLAATVGIPAQPARADVDPELVPHWLELRGVLTGHDQMFGASQVLSMARRTLGIIGRHREAARGHLRVDLMRVEARWEMLLAWLHDDTGDTGDPDAEASMGRARKLASEADDGLMVGYVLMRQSERASRHGDAETAIRLAQMAQQQSPITREVRALSVLHEALGHALAADAETCAAKLEEAHDLVERRQHDAVIDPGWDGLGRHYATETTVLANESRCWLWLAQPDKAVRSAEQALACWPATRRRGSGVQRAGLAVACVAAGERDRAAREGLDALKVAKATRSERAMVELRRLDHRLAKTPHGPGVSEFREALAAA